jgi:hypothetical protein
VQQTDITPKINTPQNIATQQTLEGVMAQVLQDQKDLAKAVQANAGAGGTESGQSLAAVNALLNLNSASQATVAAGAAASTGAAKAGGSAASSTSSSASAKATKSSGKNGNKNKNNKRRAAVGPSMRRTKRYVVVPGADFNDGGD